MKHCLLGTRRVISSIITRNFFVTRKNNQWQSEPIECVLVESIVHFAVAAMFSARVVYWDRLGAVPSREISSSRLSDRIKRTKVYFTCEMGGGDRCAVYNCDNDRRFKDR